MKTTVKICLMGLCWIAVALMAPSRAVADAQQDIWSVEPGKNKSKIASVAVQETEARTRIKLRMLVPITEWQVQSLENRNLLFLDVLCDTPPFKSQAIDIESRFLARIRVGYHPQKIRFVFDTPHGVPAHRAQASGNEIVLDLSDPGKETASEPVSPAAAPAEEAPPVADTVRIAASDQKTKTSDFQLHAVPYQIMRMADAQGNTLQRLSRAELKLTQLSDSDDQADSRLFSSGIEAYRRGNWSEAADIFSNLIEAFPEGRYEERSYFLLAKSRQKSVTEFTPRQFRDVITYYERAVSRFPNAAYVPDAYLSMGDLYYQEDSQHEALGYYNLILKRKENSIETAMASLGKIRILLQNKRRDEALPIIAGVDEMIASWPAIHEKAVVKKDLAKIYYDINNFRRSLDHLIELVNQDPQTPYRYPEISEYLGYNYFQLGDNRSAREYFFRYYNSSPDQKNINLILTQIGDTYHQEGEAEKARKIYELVIRSYPDSKGAIISQIRLAEQQESGLVPTEEIVESPIGISAAKVAPPREIYRKISDRLIQQDDKNPLGQLAMFKLLMLQHQEKDARKTLELLKELLAHYPWNSLGDNVKKELPDLFESILREEMNAGNYHGILGMYINEKDLFKLLASPRAEVTVAMAFLKLGIENKPLEIFQKVDKELTDDEKPAELILILARELYEDGAYENALKRLRVLIDTYPTDNASADARILAGRILADQKEFGPAAEMFVKSLAHPLNACQKVEAFVGLSQAFIQSGTKGQALPALLEAEKAAEDCHQLDSVYFQTMGSLYLSLGQPEKAIGFYNRAGSAAGDGDDALLIKLKLARCYELLNNPEDSLALYGEVSNGNDPFWGALAKEMMEAIGFVQEIEKLEAQSG